MDAQEGCLGTPKVLLPFFFINGKSAPDIFFRVNICKALPIHWTFFKNNPAADALRENRILRQDGNGPLVASVLLLGSTLGQNSKEQRKIVWEMECD